MEKKILIADDEPYVVRALSFIFKNEGYTVITARDGREALDQARKLKPDFIFLDIMMPRMNGYQVCRALKEDRETRGIYVSLLTANVEENNHKLGLAAGADEYVTKPFSPSKVIEKVREVLEEQSRRASDRVVQEEPGGR